jgi:hypothetical protein
MRREPDWSFLDRDPDEAPADDGPPEGQGTLDDLDDEEPPPEHVDTGGRT